jgi:hypothetical protein
VRAISSLPPGAVNNRSAKAQIRGIARLIADFINGIGQKRNQQRVRGASAFPFRAEIGWLG